MASRVPHPDCAPSPAQLGRLADTSSALLGLGRPLSRVQAPAPPVPAAPASVGHAPLDFALDARWTRTSKACKSHLAVDRMASEVYPLPAAVVRDTRSTEARLGHVTRLDGREEHVVWR